MVDEKIHYAVCRMMYARSYVRYDVLGWLRAVPLLYGVWHPYKQSLHVVYRAFLPLFALLECTGQPVVGDELCAQRRVLYLEKLVAALLLAAPALRGRIEETRPTYKGSRNVTTIN